MRREAIFDPTGVYRYLLWREWDENAPQIGFIMLNPSTADAKRDDPTIRKCIYLASSWGYGSLAVANLFAYRTAKPKLLRQVVDPIGWENDNYLLKLSHQTQKIIFAWGNHGSWLNRSQAVISLFGDRDKIYCLGKNCTGEPSHPLYLKKETLPILYQL
ncbi:hypothetical protein Ple7327_2820 [Pleurocapsa sp. PCC 7327]|uniref:DUF1643 domain-containing protein n=1 Tax=Pleurocapsa sp. PCC 7327 TaxID=118163 RepID=UPI00029FA6F4|nr:DUF1643 domain-containing protein [Pleurocapsa sp. PCC 7327]AFY78083.1 hypothetical protein Ple7327_2820 [Pleurocapsa sp. PCC 7327]